jgi:hypothetical protein
MSKDIPLTDGAFIIDNSGIEKFKCPRAFEYGVDMRRIAVGKAAGANFGSTIHRGLETRYKLVDTNPVDDATTMVINTAMHEWQQENPQPIGDFRNYDHAVKFLAVYNQIYKKETFNIITHNGKKIIESSFLLPLGTVQNIPILYSGKIDLGIESNGIWSFDHKTAFMFGEGFDKQMAMDGGQLGYCWALGQTLQVTPRGYIIDAMRVRRPKKEDEFGGTAPIDGTDFKRIPCPVSQEQVEEWKKDTLTIVSDIFNCYDRGYFPRHRWQCVGKYGICEYYDVCSTNITQREQIINSNLFEESKWHMGLKVEE